MGKNGSKPYYSVIEIKPVLDTKMNVVAQYKIIIYNNVGWPAKTVINQINVDNPTSAQCIEDYKEKYVYYYNN